MSAVPSSGIEKDQPLAARSRHAALRGLEAFAAFLMAAVAILVFVNALGRYLLARPLPWTEEIVLNMMVWIAGVGVVLAAFRGAMMCCNMLVDLLPQAALRPVRIAVALAGAAVMGFLTHATWNFIALFGNDLSPLLRLPNSIAMYGLFFASAGLTLALITQAVQAWKG